MDKLDYLIQYLSKESNGVEEELPEDQTSKKRLYRALVNIREAKPISEEFLKIEDEYLQEELENQEVTSVNDIKTIREQFGSYCNIRNLDKLSLWKGDITKLEIEAIVNAANSQGLGCFMPNHNCIDNQIQTFAGVRLRLECNEVMKTKNYNLKTGEAIITNGYNLPAKYVIHTVGPIIDDNVTEEKEKQLADCYRNSLKLAMENNIKTIAFPCISTGVFRFPKDEASKIAIKTVDEFLDNHKNGFEKVIFSVYSDEDYEIYKNLI